MIALVASAVLAALTAQEKQIATRVDARAGDALLSVLDGASRDLGQGPVPALDPGERGAGDVSFVAPYVDSLDGIGARGTGSHTVDEVVELSSIPSLIKRTAILVYRLTR